MKPEESKPAASFYRSALGAVKCPFNSPLQGFTTTVLATVQAGLAVMVSINFATVRALALVIGLVFVPAPAGAASKPAKKPNLTIKKLTVEVGGEATPRVIAEIYNSGTASADRSFYASAQIDGWEIGFKKISSLGVGKTTTIIITGELSLTEGQHAVKFLVDDTQRIEESNERDNTSSKKFDVKAKRLQFVHPLKNPKAAVNHGFGVEWDGDSTKYHAGVDLAAKAGDPIYASMDGFVEWVGDYPTQKKWKKQIVIDTLAGDPVELIYIHVEPKSGLEAGDFVFAGEKIGTVAKIYNDTGREITHLHFATRQARYKKDISTRGALPKKAGNKSSDPVWPEKFVDPTKYLKAKN